MKHWIIAFAAIAAACSPGSDASPTDVLDVTSQASVADRIATTLTLSPDTALLAPAATVQLSAAAYDDHHRRLSNPVITWVSLDPTIAAVDSHGLVTALNAGTAHVTAASGTAADTARISIVQPAAAMPSDACSTYPALRTIQVHTATELSNAIANALPGDLIRLSDGTYAGPYLLNRSGTAQSRITLCGTRKAVLDGGSVSGRTVVRLEASYWNVVGFTITNGLRGVMGQGANNNVVRDLEIFTIGQEAVHFKMFSSHNLIEGNRIHDTGLAVALYGEGVYIGSDSGTWPSTTGGLPDASDYNEVRGNVFGPNIRAENVDVKSGTTGGIIDGNTLSGVGTTEDDWVDMKGNGWQITNNTASVLTTGEGFRTRSEVAGWGNNNIFAGNIVDLQGSGYGFLISSATTGNVVKCSNTVKNAASGYANVKCTP